MGRVDGAEAWRGLRVPSSAYEKSALSHAWPSQLSAAARQLDSCGFVAHRGPELLKLRSDHDAGEKERGPVSR